MVGRISDFLLSGRTRAVVLALLFFCFGYWAGVNRSPADRFMQDTRWPYSPKGFDRKTGQECWLQRSGPNYLPTCYDVYRGLLPRWFVGDPMRYAPLDFDNLARKYGGQSAR